MMLDIAKKKLRKKKESTKPTLFMSCTLWSHMENDWLIEWLIHNDFVFILSFFFFSCLYSFIMSTLNEQIVQVVFGLANLELNISFINYSLPILNVLYAILINYSYRSALGVTHSQIGWYQGLLATLVMRAGGGCTVSILRGEPIGILKSNEFWVIHW